MLSEFSKFLKSFFKNYQHPIKNKKKTNLAAVSNVEQSLF